MKVTRKFDKASISVEVTDEEIIQGLVDKSMDERVVFFRKLFQTDLKNILSFKFLKQFM